MRILAIRGCNITSLAGEFELDLAKSPLKNVGLFTITGPTGAGKSSLLDALCLALFGTAPRLDRVAKVRVGITEDEGEKLFADDARSLVRRGTSEGFAEVDYVGEGGHRYRARWEARRARGKITGRFQPATLTLRNLDDDELIASGKDDKERAVKRTLGLTYEQFRRSALLAQGDFAAFLQERGDKRAELLAQMTGTQLYERISRLAHDRAKQADNELRVLSQSVASILMLDDEARKALEAKLQTLATAKAAKAKEVEELEAIVRFFEERSKLHTAEAEARGDHERAVAENEALATLRGELAAIERVLPLRPIIEAEKEAVAAQGEAEKQQTLADEALRAARTHLTEAEEQTASQLTAQKDAELAIEEARPALAQAARLDASMREKEQQLSSARAQLDGASKAKGETANELKSLEERLGIVERQGKDIEQWLSERIRIAKLVERWELYRVEIERFVTISIEAGRAREALSKLEREKTEATKALAAIDAAVGPAREDLDAKKTAHEAAVNEAKARAFSEALRDERDVLATKKEALDALISLASQAQTVAKQQQTERGKEGTARTSADEARRTAEEVGRAILKVEGALEEAKRALDQTRTTIDLTVHRAKLREGSPCPLCGATEHPLAKTASPLDALLATREDEARKHDEHLRSLRDQRSRAQANAEALSRAAEDASERATVLEGQLTELHARWEGLVEAAAVELEPGNPRAPELLVERRSTLEKRLVELREAERAAADWAEKARLRQDEWQRAGTKLEALAQKQQAAKDRAGQVEIAWSRHEGELERATRSLDAIAETLAPAFEGSEGWRDRLSAGPAEFFQKLERAIQTYRQKSDDLAQAKEELAKLSAQRGTALAILEEREKIEAKHREELDLREEALAADQVERAKLFEGRAVAEVEAALQGAVVRAREAVSKAQEAERSARDQAQNAAQKLAAAEAANEHALRTASAKGRELRERLASLDMDRAKLDGLLAHDDAWLASTRERIEEARTKLKEAEIRLGERQRARVEHEGKAPQASEDEARAKLVEGREALQAATDGMAEAQAELRRDEEARRLHSSKEEELARARKDAERWKSLDLLIGSADGKKFRTFAQSLTLDALLAYANEHLRDLAPRYRLMRVPGHDMELQIIDSDMADEVRGTNSLSGGETFLVSLALALALSSLASREVRIDTLFIDEGFGALDPQTLDMAISALESLQATGRQVGVISHVRALSEKIGTQVRVQRLGAGRSRLVLGQKSSEASVFG